jgi:hypothetical protein
VRFGLRNHSRIVHSIQIHIRTAPKDNVSARVTKLGPIALHGTAWRHAAKQHNLAESVAELPQIAGGRDDILADAAGITAGSWYAWPSTHVGHELITAGMLIMACGSNGKPLDYDELERWTRIGYERGMRSRQGER